MLVMTYRTRLRRKHCGEESSVCFSIVIAVSFMDHQRIRHLHRALRVDVVFLQDVEHSCDDPVTFRGVELNIGNLRAGRNLVHFEVSNGKAWSLVDTDSTQ